jgi:hypothetical protein
MYCALSLIFYNERSWKRTETKQVGEFAWATELNNFYIEILKIEFSTMDAALSKTETDLNIVAASLLDLPCMFTTWLYLQIRKQMKMQ